MQKQQSRESTLGIQHTDSTEKGKKGKTKKSTLQIPPLLESLKSLPRYFWSKEDKSSFLAREIRAREIRTRETRAKSQRETESIRLLGLRPNSWYVLPLRCKNSWNWSETWRQACCFKYQQNESGIWAISYSGRKHYDCSSLCHSSAIRKHIFSLAWRNLQMKFFHAD